MNAFFHFITRQFNRLSRTGAFILGLSLVLLFGVTDILLSNELVFSVFYLLPVSLTAWYAGRRQAVTVSALSVLVLFADDVASRSISLETFMIYWEAAARLAFFTTLAYALSALRTAYEHQRSLARTDPLTEVANSRSFYELARIEIERAKRFGCSLTLAYIDIDDFKRVNDTYGHAVGDYVLRRVARALRQSVRDIDLVARMGGDEFAVLMCRADRREAGKVMKRIQANLAQQLKAHRWGVTLSIGCVTVKDQPPHINDLIAAADRLMYKVKTAGKNSALFETI